MKIPKRQKDIKLKSYLEYQDFVANLTDEQKLDERLILKTMIMIFYEIDNEKYDSLPFTQLSDMTQIIDNIFKMKVELVPTFKIDKVEYGLVPNFDDLTLAELVDCSTDNVIQQMCVLYRPILNKKKNKYTIQKYKAEIDIELFKEHLTLDIYNGFVSFFLKIQNGLMHYTLKSLTEMDITAEQKKNLEENGPGFLGSMNSVMEI